MDEAFEDMWHWAAASHREPTPVEAAAQRQADEMLRWYAFEIERGSMRAGLNLEEIREAYAYHHERMSRS